METPEQERDRLKREVEFWNVNTSARQRKIIRIAEIDRELRKTSK